VILHLVHFDVRIEPLAGDVEELFRDSKTGRDSETVDLGDDLGEEFKRERSGEWRLALVSR